jgi:hypothetical protein
MEAKTERHVYEDVDRPLVFVGVSICSNLATLRKSELRTVIYTDDRTDRGSESRGIVERLIATPSKGWNWRYPLGNHEGLLIQASQNCLTRLIHGEHGFWLASVA